MSKRRERRNARCQVCGSPIFNTHDAEFLRSIGYCPKHVPAEYRCQAITEKKTQCKLYTVQQSHYCEIHLPQHIDKTLYDIGNSMLDNDFIHNADFINFTIEYLERLYGYNLNLTIQLFIGDPAPEFKWRCQSGSAYQSEKIIAWDDNLEYCLHNLVRQVEKEIESRKPPKIDYHEYINSPEWKAKAEKAKERAGWKCQLCNKHGNNGSLHAHHRTYERLGHEDDNDITVLCADCHAKFHDIEKQ